MLDFRSGGAVPGVYDGLTFEEYRKIPAMNSSKLVTGIKSMLHLKAALDGGEEKDTGAMEFGRAFHTAILEPEKFDAGYVLHGEKIDKRTKEGKATLAALAGGGRAVLDGDDAGALTAMRGAIRDHPQIGPIFAAAGRTELTLVWRDDETGVMCKCRLDKWSEGLVIDLKTTRDASPIWFKPQIYKLGYHVQGSWYIDGAVAALGDFAQHIIIAAEKAMPWLVVAYRMTQDMLDAGRRVSRGLLRQYVEALDSGRWLGYEEAIETELPDWTKKGIDNNGEEEE